MTDLKIAAVYIRVSTDDQVELSPESQLAEIRAHFIFHFPTPPSGGCSSASSSLYTRSTIAATSSRVA